MPHSKPLQTTNTGFRFVLRNHAFQRLWLAQLLSQTVQNAANYGAIVVLAQSQSVVAVGGAVIAFSLPAVIFGVPAGVLVDRFNKRAVMWISNVLRALASFGFVLAVLLDFGNIAIYLLTFFISIVGQFFAPAEGASIPLLVEEDDLVPALSLFNITFSISQAAGFIIVGPLILLLAPTIGVLNGLEELFIFIGLIYLVCALLIASVAPHRFISRSAHAEAVISRQITGVWRGMAEAWNAVRLDPRLFGAVAQLTMGGTVIAVVGMIAPSFAENFMHLRTDQAAVVFVPAGIGLVAGSALMPRIVNRVSLPVAEALGVVGVGSAIVLLTISRALAGQISPHWYALPPYVAVVMLLTFSLGLSLDLVTLPAQTVMQRRAQDRMRGRVLALQMVLLNAFQIPVILIIGAVADRSGLAVAMNLLAIGVITLGLTSVYLAEVQMKPVVPPMPLRRSDVKRVKPPAPIPPARSDDDLTETVTSDRHPLSSHSPQ
jgi:MFS family permease